MPALKIPHNTPARKALLLEQEHADAVNKGRKQWEHCVRLCMRVYRIFFFFKIANVN